MAAQRLLELQTLREKRSDLARRLGLDPRTLGAYYRGESGASVEAIETAVRVGGVNAHWLLTGEGPRYHDKDEPAAPGEAHHRLIAALEKARGVVEDLSQVVGPGSPDRTPGSDADE